MNTNNTDLKSWQEAEALKRFSLIAPLLQEDLDEAKKLMLRRQIAEQNNISVRMLYRYENSYWKAEFSGLKPANRGKRRSQNLPENFEELLGEAIQLRREVPQRSVNQIITILESEQRVLPGTLKRRPWNTIFIRQALGQSRCRHTWMSARVLQNGSVSRTG